MMVIRGEMTIGIVTVCTTTSGYLHKRIFNRIVTQAISVPAVGDATCSEAIQESPEAEVCYYLARVTDCGR